ncbi:MAG: hypothetical protein N4J56_007364 [Chroococcidiopsis sp. SAG 2025]|nr:hypothetical protein [Chroococcidiopsis sp. SAG 2025]
MLTTILDYPNIDRLLDRFASESKPFFANLNRSELKELRKYIDYRKASHKDNWGFSPHTVATLNSIDCRTKQFYLQHLKYQQLSLGFM